MAHDTLSPPPLPDTRTHRFGVAPDSAYPGAKGKLRLHSDDGYQFQYDDGDWFLHIGDTGYRYLVDGEPLWQQYVTMQYVVVRYIVLKSDFVSILCGSLAD